MSSIGMKHVPGRWREQLSAVRGEKISSAEPYGRKRYVVKFCGTLATPECLLMIFRVSQYLRYTAQDSERQLRKHSQTYEVLPS